MVWIFSLKLSYLAPRSEIRKPIEDGVLFGLGRAREEGFLFLGLVLWTFCLLHCGFFPSIRPMHEVVG